MTIGIPSATPTDGLGAKRRQTLRRWVLLLCIACMPVAPAAQQSLDNQLRGRVTDETGGALPGVTVGLRAERATTPETVTHEAAEYSFQNVPPGQYQLTFSLINFASIVRRDVKMSTGVTRVDAVMHVSLSAEVAVVAKRTFANLEDMDDPAANLVGVAQAASQGAVTARQLGEPRQWRCQRTR
jgi:Carboxypeptidase regulatory-like domain